MSKKYYTLFGPLLAAVLGAAAGRAAVIDRPGPPAGLTLEIFGNADANASLDVRDVREIRALIRAGRDGGPFADADRNGVLEEADARHVQALLAGTAPFIWLLDGNGEAVKVRLPVRRIGAEFLSNAELMLVLGAEDRVVALDTAAYERKALYFPDSGSRIVDLGPASAADPERVLEQDLDVLFTFSFDSAAKKEMLPGVDVVFLGMYWPDLLDPGRSRFIQGVLKAGWILGRAEKAEAYVGWLTGLMEQLRRRTAGIPEDRRPRVLMTGLSGAMRDPDQTTVRTYTRADPLSQMALLAGGRPLAAELPDWGSKNYYVTVDPEWIMVRDPEFIFVHTVQTTIGGTASGPAAGYGTGSTEAMERVRADILRRPFLAGVSAVRNGRIYVLAGDLRNNAMGGVLGALYLSRILDPEGGPPGLDPVSVHREYAGRWLGLDGDLTKQGVFVYPGPRFGTGGREP